MASWLVSVGLVAALFGQSDAGAVASPEAIEKAIGELGSAQFSTRREAAQFLWRQGLAVQPALERAAENQDPEVRLSARRILLDFRYGILPEVAPADRSLMRRYRDGNADEARAALRLLADRSRFEMIERLLQCEVDPGKRQEQILHVLQSDRAAEHFLELDVLEKLITSVCPDQGHAWQRRALARSFFAEKVVRKRIEQGQLKILVETIEREESADLRQQMRSMLFSHSASLAALVEKDQLRFILDLAAKEADGQMRGNRVATLLSSPDVVEQLVERDQLSAVVAIAQANVESKQRGHVLWQLFNPSIARVLLAKRGITGLIVVATAEPDPEARGGLVTALMASPVIHENLTQSERFWLMIELARGEKDAIARNIYLESMLAPSDIDSMLQKADCRGALWALVRAESGNPALPWRGVAVDRLLERSSPDEVLQEIGETEWLLKFLKDVSSRRSRIISHLVTDPRWRSHLLENDHFETLLDSVRELPAVNRSGVLPKLLCLCDPLRRVGGVRCVDLMVSLAKQESNREARFHYLAALFQLETAMQALVDAGYYDDLWAMVCGEKDAVRQGGLRGCFLQTDVMVKEVSKRDQVRELVNFAWAEGNLTAKRDYLRRLFANRAATSMLLDRGYLEELHSLARGDWECDSDSDAVLLETFYSNVEVVDLLIKERQVGVLLDYAEKRRDDQRRAEYVYRFCSNQRAVAALAEQGRIKSLLDLAGGLQHPRIRTLAIGEVFTAPQLPGLCKANGQLELLFGFLKHEPSDTRRQVLTSLFRDTWAMPAWVETGCYDDLCALVSDEKDPVARAALRGSIIQTSAVVELMSKRNERDLLLAYARDEDNASAKRAYLWGLFASEPAVSLLLSEGHFDTLHGLARGDDELLYQFYCNAEAVDGLIQRGQATKVLEFAENLSDPAKINWFVQLLVNNDKAVANLAQHGKIEAVLAQARRLDSYRASVVGRVFAVPQVLRCYADDGKLGELFQCLIEETPETRQQIFTNLSNQPDSMLIIAKSDGLDDYLALVNQERHHETRADLLVRSVCHTKVMQYLAATKQLDLLIQLAKDQKDETARGRYLQRLLGSWGCLETMLDQGYFDALYTLAGNQTDADHRTQCLAALLVNERTIEYLVANERFAWLLGTAGKAADDRIRHDVLVSICGCQEAIAECINLGRFDDFLALCRIYSESNSYRQMLADLLESEEAIGELAKAGTLNQMVQEVLQEPAASTRRRFLLGWCRSPYHRSIDALLANGQFGILRRACDAEVDPVERRRLLGELMTRPRSIEQVVAAGETDELLKTIAEETDDRRQFRYLTNFVSSTEAIRALLSDGRFDELLELMKGQPPHGTHCLGDFLANLATIEYLAAHGRCDRFLEEVARHDDLSLPRRVVDRWISEPAGRQLLMEAHLGDELVALHKLEVDIQYRCSSAAHIITESLARQAFFESGQVSSIFELANFEPNEDRRRGNLQQLFLTPTGLLSYYLRHGDHQQAERQIREYFDGDSGRLNLATYLLAANRIDQRIAELQKGLKSPPELVADAEAAPREGEVIGVSSRIDDARLLTYLLRAKGDAEGACEAARLAKDPGLLQAVLVEAGRWSDAAQLQAAGLCPLPIPVESRSVHDDERQRVEQLGLLAAYQRLVGRDEDCQKSLAQIRSKAASPFSEPALRRLCAKMLLLNNCGEEELSLPAEMYPSWTFQLYAHRRQYREAFELAGVREGVLLDRTWFDSLPVNGEDAGQLALARLEFAIDVAQTLHFLGRKAEALQIIDMLEIVADQQPDGRSKTAPRNQCWQRLCAALLEMRYEQRAWQAGARTLATLHSTPPMQSNLYPDRYYEANCWWSVFRHLAPSEPPAETFHRVHQIVNPRRDEDVQEFSALANKAAEAAQDFTDARRKFFLAAVAAGCRRRGQLNLARECLSSVQPSDEAATMALAAVLRDSELWLEAADRYQAVWEYDHRNRAALHLAGDALLRAGQSEMGRQRKQQADEIVLEGKYRLILADSLIDHGLKNEGVRQLELALRTGPCGHPEWFEAARRLGELRMDDAPAEAAHLLELTLLHKLRTTDSLSDYKNYLHTRALIHRLRARAAVNAETRDRDPEVTD